MVDDDYYNKYLKYKNKYLQLKSSTNKGIKGGNLMNLKNTLVMGGGPVGLITALALLTRYAYKSKKSTNPIDCDNIFLTEISNPWRPQIFFFQNSFRDYDSIDFIRDIDLRTFEKIEQIGCYIGSPPSTAQPYCFSRTDASGNYRKSALAINNTSIRAPKNIPINPKADGSFPDPDDKLYMMHHLSFHVSDLETILLDRLITLNNENIKFYLNYASQFYDDNSLQDIVSKIDRFKSTLLCNKDLFKALVIKDYLKKNNLIKIEDFRPLLILVHPYNGFCNINSYILSSRFITTNKLEADDIKELRKSLEKAYIDIDDIESNFILKKEQNGDITLCKQVDKYQNKNVCKSDEKQIKFISNEDYDLVFEAESGNKQFGRKDDYWVLRNREKMSIDSKKELDKNLMIPVILDKNSIIELKTSTQSDIYIIDKSVLSMDIPAHKFKWKYDLYKLSHVSSPTNTDINDLEQYDIVDKTKYELSFDIDFKEMQDEIIKLCLQVKKTDINTLFLSNFGLDIDNTTGIYSQRIVTTSKDLIKIFKSHGYEMSGVTEHFSTPDNDNNILFNQLLMKYLLNSQIIQINVKNTVDSTNILYDNIYKINSLMIEETPMDLKDNAKNALVFASVLLYKADKINNLMNTDQMELTRIQKDNRLDIQNIPLCSGPMCVDNFDTYEDRYKKTQVLRKRVDYGSMINQIYINNDQVQYFNNIIRGQYNLGKLKNPNLTQLFHTDGFRQSIPQHAFRVFGVNIYNKKALDLSDVDFKRFIKTDELKKFFEITSTKPTYYTGIQVSTEINKLYIKINRNTSLREDEKIYLKDLIMLNLYILGYLFSNNQCKYGDTGSISEIDIIIKEWNETYGKKKAITYKELIDNPIDESKKSIFTITLKYKENTVETENNKIIFNMGDSNTTVNFFSGTGLNTGISNIRNILDNFNYVTQDTTNINETLKVKNRRTIYNSLLSSQNPSYLSPLRKFTIPSSTIPSTTNNSGFYIKNISEKNNFDEIKAIAIKIILRDIQSNILMVQHNKNIKKYLDNFEDIFNKISTTTLPLSTETKQYVENIKKATYFNTFVCLYNLVFNPVLGNLDYNQESISYANHLIFNHFDLCNFMTGSNTDSNNNKGYQCDVIKDDSIPYDSRRSTQYFTNSRYDT
jgi:hypothetical protein